MGYGRGVGIGVNVLSKYCQGMQPQQLMGHIPRWLEWSFKKKSCREGRRVGGGGREGGKGVCVC